MYRLFGTFSLNEAPKFEFERIFTRRCQYLLTKLSNIVERDLYIDSDSFKSLSPKMKDAVKDIYEKIQKERAKVVTLNQGMKDLVAELAKVESKITEFNGISEKLYDNKLDLTINLTESEKKYVERKIPYYAK